jgi:tRNA(Met) C34 N-acetyltransferase TmcA
MVAARCYIATVDQEPVAHLAISPRLDIGCMRACRLVVLPEWQGAGIGMRFLNHICQRQLDGLNRWSRKTPTLFHTSHPGLAAALRRDSRWVQVSAKLCGASKAKSAKSMLESARKAGRPAICATGYGGHFRAVQGFKYIGACE